jgi:putative FmdB family regulatory protein
MPIYEYECTKCGERFELRRSIADRDADVECPECHDEHPRRLCSMFGSVMASRPEFSNAGPT